MTLEKPSKEGPVEDIVQPPSNQQEWVNFDDKGYLRAFCERNLKFEFFAPHSYRKLWTEVNPACAVTHLAQYIESASQLPNKEDRLKPLREFFESSRAGQIMQENIQSLIKSAYPSIEKHNWQKDMESLGLYIINPNSIEVSVYFKGYEFHGSI